jgi:DNA-binding NtrC family response regulator
MDLPVILIVDDEIGVRESLRMVFKDDFRVLDADSLETTISAVRDEKPHVVLLDVLMPRTDGIEVLKQIKSIEPRCEVIILTALNTEQIASKAMLFGAFDFVGKPFDVGELRRKVDQALEKLSNHSAS